MSLIHSLGKIVPSTARRYLRKRAARAQGRQIVNLLHIGKTGGTAIKHVFRQNLDTEKAAIFIWRHVVTLKHVPEGEKVIFVTREPISRFISGFFSRQRQGLPRHHMPWTPAEERAFAEFTTPNELGLALSSTNGAKRERAETAMRGIKHVGSSYWDWFVDETYFRSRFPDILYIGRQENLSADFQVMKNLLGLPAAADLPNDDVQAHRNPVTANKKLEEAALANLKRWYVREFEFLDVCRELAPKLNTP